jgi:hypothetical protein
METENEGKAEAEEKKSTAQAWGIRVVVIKHR